MTVCSNLQAEINLPPAIKDRGDNVHQLPPHREATVYPVETYPAAPARWMRGGPTVSSYFIGVKAGLGMWLDFNKCNLHKHDVAVLVSVQGVNPITGQKAYGQGLQQYLTKCPVHDCDFGQERFCPECKFKWPKQNYLATTGTPNGMFWLDGFRSENGKVRQYVFTEEEMRGIAAQTIGEERVFAIGIAFYLSKEPKPTPPPSPLRSYYKGGSGLMGSKKLYAASLSAEATYSASIGGVSCFMSRTLEAPHISMVERDTSEMCVTSDASMEERLGLCDTGAPEPARHLEVGAGAQIDQCIHDDPKELDYWKPEPEGLIVLNYADARQLAEILAAGRREEKPGFMAELNTGNA